MENNSFWTPLTSNQCSNGFFIVLLFFNSENTGITTLHTPFALFKNLIPNFLIWVTSAREPSKRPKLGVDRFSCTLNAFFGIKTTSNPSLLITNLDTKISPMYLNMYFYLQTILMTTWGTVEIPALWMKTKNLVNKNKTEFRCCYWKISPSCLACTKFSMWPRRWSQKKHS